MTKFHEFEGIDSKKIVSMSTFGKGFSAANDPLKVFLWIFASSGLFSKKLIQIHAHLDRRQKSEKLIFLRELKKEGRGKNF